MQRREDSQNFVTELQKQLEDKKTENEKLEELLKELQKQLGDKKKENNNLKDVIKELQKRSQDKKKEEKNLQEEIKQLRKRLEQQEQKSTHVEGNLKQEGANDVKKQEQPTSLQEQLIKTNEHVNFLQEILDVCNERIDDLQRQLSAREQQVKDLEGKEAERRKKVFDLQANLTARERQINYLQTQEERARDKQITELEKRDKQVADLREQLEKTLSTDQQTLDDRQSKEPCEWVIPRDEIHLTDTCLGTGSWGRVSLGRFRGCQVAVKEIHELVISDLNKRLFEREMSIASRCRHPCLLQFIGATNNAKPLFVTELMKKSLRALLEHQVLNPTDISVISLDIALALNYLHRSKPPIIHRDISSGNVLLWRCGDQWRGKLSDYGTANFMYKSNTIGPGTPIYSPPEASTPNQTVKVKLTDLLLTLCLY